MKKILKNWNSFLTENKDNNDPLLDKVRDLFFGAYNSWEDDYKQLHDAKFESLLKQLEATAKEKFQDPRKIQKVINGANIGLSLYWTDHPSHGAGSRDTAGFVVEKKLEILESNLTTEDKERLKSGLMKSIIDSVSEDKSDQMYPTTLAVSVGVINGVQVDDAFMTTSKGINQLVIPILQSKGYYGESERPTPKKDKKKKEYEPEMSFADMKAMMDKFGR